jgi:putative hydrolase of the HAD superfamily
MPIHTLFIDLDDTLYPKTSGLWDAIRARINRYMQECLGFDPQDIPRLREQYFTTYGTTLRGLQINHAVEPEDYLNFVHAVPVGDYLSPDAALRETLDSLPQPKWIFTNADANHSRRVLAALGLSECFAGIIDVWAMQYQCKPNPEVYRLALQLAGAARPQDCLLVDDSPRNLAPALALGFHTALVGAQEYHPAARYHLTSLHQLPAVLNGAAEEG